MAEQVALLVDFDGFWQDRESAWRRKHPDTPFDPDADLRQLLQSLGVQPTVARAYADFQVARRDVDGDRWDHYLRHGPKTLAAHQIEPVQVFRHPSCARPLIEVRMALDAVGLRGALQHIVLVGRSETLNGLAMEVRSRGFQVTAVDTSELAVQNVAAAAGGAAPEARPREPQHTVQEYRYLLRMKNPRVHVVDLGDWRTITELFFDRAAGDGGEERPEIVQAELTASIIAQCEELDIESADKKVQATVFQLFKAGCFVCAEEGLEGRRDFHWSKPARLAEDLRDVRSMRLMARTYIARLLYERLESAFGTSEVDAQTFAELLEGADVSEDRVDQLEEILDAV